MAGIDSNSVLVCRMDGSGTSFVDSSPSHKTVTANGNATQATRKFNGTGAWFDGSVDTNMLFVPDSADWNFGSSAYTIESFVMFAPGDDGRSVIYEDYTDGSNYSRLEYSWAAGLWQYAISSGGGPLITAIQYSNTPNKSQWYHIAIVRNGTDVRMYLDGTSVGSTTATFTYPNYTAGLAIGGTTINSGYGLTGWLKEMRVSNSARYTSGFTPTTSQFTSDSNTKLLLHFDNALATGPLAPAIKFDGSGDYLSIADSADWDFGTGDYTIEGWFMWPGSMDNGYLIFRANGGGNVCDLAYEAGIVYHYTMNNVLSASYALVANRWYHIAASRSGTSRRLFVDGVIIASDTNSSDCTQTTPYLIAASTGPTNEANVMVREIRISNSARYTAAFTPSQTGFTVDSNTKLYIKGNEANGVTTFLDSSTTPKTVTTFGNTAINYIEDYRTTIFKDDGNTGHKPYAPVASLAKVDFLAPFGAGVGVFPDSGYLTVPDSSDWDFGTGSFCLEGYFRFVNVSDNNILFTRNGVNDFRFAHIGSLNQLEWSVESTSTAYSVVLYANIWYHLAMVRSSGTITVYLNGVSVGSTANSGDIQGTDIVYLGFSTSDGFNGYIENARISNVARYTATFNPPGQFNTGGLNQAVIL